MIDPIQNRTDLLAEFTNGYDGVLERLETRLENPLSDTGISALVVLRVVRPDQEWFRLTLRFGRTARISMDAGWFVGGGAVLYNGARLLVPPDQSHALLDLDPGVAWTVVPVTEHRSTFVLEGSLTSVAFEPIRPERALPR